VSGPLSIDRRGAVEIVALDRPAHLNAMDEPLIGALLDYFVGLSDRTEVRVVILRAEGRHFCAGLDF
jgi:enoyl-CoA hydratase/carnithine racemase